MKVSIIIPVYNEEKDIGNCIESLKKQTFKDFETIIVDDGSTDRTLEIVKKFAKVRIIKGEHKGAGISRNLGAKKARGRILVFIDADMTFDKNYIKNLIKPLLNNKEVIGTSHDYEVAVNTKNKWSRLWGEIRVSKKQAKDVKIFRAIRKDKFLKLGGFDSRYGYADDQTLWIKHGVIPVIAPNTICYHKNPETLKSTYMQSRWIGTSWKERYFWFKIPILSYIAALILIVLLPLMILGKAAKTILHSDYKFIDLIRFYSAKFGGYCMGVLDSVFLNKFSR